MTAAGPQPTALVTGASSGIGRAIAERLLSEGHGVLGLARSFRAPPSPGLVPIPLDLARLEELPRRLEALVGRYPKVEWVISNVGRGRFGSLEEFSYDQLRSLVELNFLSHAFVARAWLPVLKRRGGGHLVFMGSEAALRGSRRGALYCATKFALRGFAQALREESSSSGVRVSIVHPGMVRTPFFDELSFSPGEAGDEALEPSDVAEAVWGVLSARPGAVIEEVTLTPQRRVIRRRRRGSVDAANDGS